MSVWFLLPLSQIYQSFAVILHKCKDHNLPITTNKIVLWVCDIGGGVELQKYLNSEFTNLHTPCTPNVSRLKHRGAFVASVSPTEVNQTTGKLCKICHKLNFSLQEYNMKNPCVKDKPSFMNWSERFAWKKECPCVYSRGVYRDKMEAAAVHGN